MLPESDRIRLLHMVDAAQAAQSFVVGKSRGDLENARLLTSGLVREIEIVGEAATHISRETRRAHSTIPWRQIVGMRNRLIHGYFEVDLDLLWVTVVDDLPLLVKQLDHIPSDS